MNKSDSKHAKQTNIQTDSTVDKPAPAESVVNDDDFLFTNSLDRGKIIYTV